jgi:hypothetical protein
MKQACLLVALLAILLSVGCGKKRAGLSGTYKDPAADDATMTLHDDGTFEGKSAAEAVKGTYKLDGTKLSMTVKEVNGEPPKFVVGEPIVTATVSDDGKSLSLGGIKYIKHE